MHESMQEIMMIQDALRGLIGNPTFVALLPGGPVLVMSNRQLILDVRGRKPHRYAGKLSDYLSLDWVVMTGPQFQAYCAQQEKEAKGG